MKIRPRPSLALSLVACGPTPSAPDASTAPVDAASVDAAFVFEDGGPFDAGFDFTERMGDVYFFQYAEPPGDYASQLSAGFVDVTDAPGIDVLDVEGDGCRMRVRLSDFAHDYSDTAVSAGTITVATDASTDVLTLEPGAAAFYSAQSFVEPHWATGEALTVHAAGDDVPAFDATLEMPAPIVFEIPAEPPPTDRVHLMQNAPYLVRWTPVEGGLANIRFAQSTVSGGMQREMTLECSFDASLGTATIPVEIMRALLTTGATITFVSVGGSATTRPTAGDVSIGVTAYAVTLATSVSVD